MNDEDIASMTFGEITELVARLLEELQMRYMEEVDTTCTQTSYSDS